MGLFLLLRIILNIDYMRLPVNGEQKARRSGQFALLSPYMVRILGRLTASGRG
jgi:hypothetical protein